MPHSISIALAIRETLIEQKRKRATTEFLNNAISTMCRETVVVAHSVGLFTCVRT